MLKTEFKAKPPPGMSYPLGAEVLSEALSKVPQYPNIELAFSFEPGIQKRYRDPILMLASFVKWDKTVSSSGAERLADYYKGKWSLWVYTVPSKNKAHVRETLIETGLPALVNWFSRERPPSWYFGEKDFLVLAKGDYHMLSVEEITEKI